MRLGGSQSEVYTNPPNHKNSIFEFHLSDGLGDQPLVRCVDLTRLQRASKGSRKSTGSSRDDVIQSGGMRVKDVWRDLVVFGDRAVHAEDDWL